MEYKLYITVDSNNLVELWDGNELPPYAKFTGVWKHQDAPAISAYLLQNQYYESDMYDSYELCPDYIQDYIEEHNIEWPNDENAKPHKITLTIKEGW